MLLLMVERTAELATTSFSIVDQCESYWQTGCWKYPDLKLPKKNKTKNTPIISFGSLYYGSKNPLSTAFFTDEMHGMK